MKSALLVSAWGHVAAVLTRQDVTPEQVAAQLAADKAQISDHAANAIKSLVDADSYFRDSRFFVDGLKEAQATLEKDLTDEISANNKLEGIEKLLLETKANIENIADEISTQVATEAKADLEKQADQAEARVKELQANMFTPPAAHTAPTPSAQLAAKPYLEALSRAQTIMSVYRSDAQGKAIEAEAYQRQASVKNDALHQCADPECKNMLLDQVNVLSDKAENIMREARASWEKANEVYKTLGWYEEAASEARDRADKLVDPQAPLLPRFTHLQ